MAAIFPAPHCSALAVGVFVVVLPSENRPKGFGLRPGKAASKADVFVRPPKRDKAGAPRKT